MIVNGNSYKRNNSVKGAQNEQRQSDTCACKYTKKNVLIYCERM